MSAGTLTPRPRRSQEERRAATRQALLDAALVCLLEDGFPGLTTRRVAARAGVSPPTLRFYFPTRAEFVAAAVEQLAAELLRQHRERATRRTAPAASRFESWLDELWEICQGPAFHAMVELSCAARVDDDARDSFAVAERALTKHIGLSARDQFADQVTDPRFRALIDLATASMRGLAMFLPVAAEGQLDQRWRAVRDELSRSYDSIAQPAE